MKRVYVTLSLIVLLTAQAGGALAQRSRSVGDSPNKPDAPPAANTAAAPAPQSVKAKYEGGVFGFNKAQTGTLSFDDASSRLVFRDKTGKEYISIPYRSIAAAHADTRSRRPTAASVIGGASLYTLPALFIRKKYRYLTMQFNDPDTQVQGVTSFKLDNKEILTSLLKAVAQKADLTPRGEAYVRATKNTEQNKSQDQDQ